MMNQDSVSTEDCMALDKLIEARRELHEKRDAIDAAIKHLDKAIDQLQPEHEGRTITLGTVVAPTPPREGSHLDNVLKVLKAVVAPLHIRDITNYVEKKTGKPVSRATLEGSIARHMREWGTDSLIARIGPSRYTLREHVGNLPDFDPS